MKIKFIFVILLFLQSVYGSSFILDDSGLIDPRAKEKIYQIGSEVKAKLGVNIYIDLKLTNGIDMDLPRKKRIELIRQKDKEILKKVQGNYAVIVLALEQKYANILLSDSLKSIIDVDDVLTGYVIPLLASKDKNTLMAKASAAVLNGYAQIADSLAEQKGIKLDSSIGSGGKTASTIWKVFMYTLVLFGIGAYTVIVLREKKYKKV